MAKKRSTQIDIQEVQWDDEELKQRIEQRRRANTIRRRRRRLLTLFVIAAAFVLLATMVGKDIIRLKAENRALKKQQIALELQRDELQEELKHTNNQEYIREQARKQLRLLNPGEILFTFDEEEPTEDPEETDRSEKEEKSGKDTKDEDSDG